MGVYSTLCIIHRQDRALKERKNSKKLLLLRNLREKMCACVIPKHWREKESCLGKKCRLSFGTFFPFKLSLRKKVFFAKNSLSPSLSGEREKKRRRRRKCLKLQHLLRRRPSFSLSSLFNLFLVDRSWGSAPSQSLLSCKKRLFSRSLTALQQRQQSPLSSFVIYSLKYVLGTKVKPKTPNETKSSSVQKRCF